MSLIPSGSELKGCGAKISIQRKLVLPIGDQMEDFGVLCEKEVELKGQKFNRVGWVGGNGKNMPIAANYIETPGKSADGSHDKPSLRLFCEVNGDLVEYVAGFKKEGKNTGKVFYTGTTNFSPKDELTFWPIVKREQAPEGNSTEGSAEV